jgi:diaminohydroxyphosphoribosylaminopyrimidine deaminase/5-amino-6-(5-phosphoribosylamino)uracil reductase
MEKDISYMRRALDLAVLGRGKVSPNPLVGCVIVHKDSIIGEGYHKCYGEAHAEVNAINSVADKSLLPESTLYVNLEPCSHYGKTPPCADLIVKHKFKRVVVSNIDVNPLVAGKGLQKLKNAGIEISVGLLEEEGRNMNKRFFTFVTKQKPYVILKWAETADGFIAPFSENTNKLISPTWISNEFSKTLVHKWRTEEEAIMIGTQTALLDNPQLNVRNWTGRNPLRVVIDKQLRLPKNLHIFDQQQPTICYNVVKNEVIDNLEFAKIKPDGFLYNLLQDLYFRKVQSVIIEGGAKLLNSFLETDMWDEIRLFRSPKTFGKGIAAPRPQGNVFYKENIADDTLWVYRRSV